MNPEHERVERTVDPVCGLNIPRHAEVCSEYNGQHYCFCDAECKEEFDAEPEIYAQPARE